MGRLLEEPPMPWEYDEECMPRPCVVHPTRVREFPGRDLPDDVRKAIGPGSEELEDTFGVSYWDVAVTTQTKVGGYPGWIQEPDWPDCSTCGERMEHLLTVHSQEPFEGSPWLPEEDRAGTGPVWRRPVDPERVHALGPGPAMCLGDMGGVYLFECTGCPGRPYEHRYDCR
jgi:hypothetical protein